MVMKRRGELNIVNFRCWEFGVLRFHLLESIVLSVCALPSRSLGRGWRWSRKATGSVPQHARLRILQTLVLYVARTQI